MSLFLYPKAQHQRLQTPRQFKTYKPYKRWLQAEFYRLCVYCRQPDSSAPNLNFGVDHYKPKGLRRFAELAVSYGNLYYCCGNCNSRKRDYWPRDDQRGPHIVNPCDHVMAKHLRFNINTSFVDTLSEHGRFTAERLQLNEPVTVRFRSNTLANLVLCVKQLGHLNSEADAVSNAWKKGKLSDAVRSLELGDIDRQIREMASLIQDLQGLTPLPPLPKSRLGVPL